MIVDFAFGKIFESSNDGAIRFFRSIGVTDPENAEPLRLLQATAGLKNTLEHLPPHTQRVIKAQAKAAFKALTGEDIHDTAKRLDPAMPYQEMAGADMMPRKTQQIGRAKELNMKMSDELMQTTMEDDGQPPSYHEYRTMLKQRGWNSAGGSPSQYHNNAIAFRFFSPKKGTLDVYVRNQRPFDQSPALGWWLSDVPYKLSGRGTGLDALIAKLDALDPQLGECADANSFEVIGTPQFATTAQLRGYAQDAANTDVHGIGVISGALAMDQMGAIAHALAGAEPDADDYTLDVEWFSDATQELIDRTSNGEKWIEVTNELARRFAEFFDGSYVAFDFAADAFGRRAWEMGLWESQAMVEAFDRDGNFLNCTIPVTESIAYRGRTVTLKRTGPTRILHLAEGASAVTIKNRSRK